MAPPAHAPRRLPGPDRNGPRPSPAHEEGPGLLAYLALPPGRAHPRDKLVTLLWGDSPEGPARNSLRQALFALRRALPPDAVRGESDTIALDPSAVEVDVAAFERGVADGTPAALAAAVPLYRGDLLAGLSVEGTGDFEEWLLGERERLRELALEGLARLLAHQRAAGATEAAVQTGLALVGLDPLQEPAHRALMRLSAEAGRRGAALRQYQQCVGVLRRELGVEPEAETKQLYQELLRQRPGRAASSDRLAPAPRAPDREVSAPETPLIGRDVELAMLRNALAEAGSGHGRAVAVLGEAGVGKSRLLVEAATEARQAGSHVLIGRAYESAQILPFGFTHDRIREVVYGGLLPPRRKLLHGDVAVALEALTAGALDPPAGALGLHYRHAEVWDKAVSYLRQAGLKALARSSNREAVAYFEQALTALSHLPETRETLEQAVDLRFDLRTSLFPLGQVLRVLDYLQEADRLAQRLDDPRRSDRLSVYMSHILHVMGRPNAAREFGEKARAIAEPLGDLSIKVGATFYIGASCYFAGDYGSGLAFLRETVQSLEGDLGRERYGLVGLPAVMARTYLTWIHAERGEFEAALAHGRDGVRLAEAVDHPYSLIIACWGLLYLHAGRQELDHVHQLSERALALARKWDPPLPSAITTGIVGHAYAVAGRTADGLALLEASVRLHESSGLVYYHSLIVAYLAEAYLLAGRPDDARVSGEQALGLARERGERGFEAWALRTLGEIAAQSDPPDVERARRRYGEALALATELGMRPLAAHCHLGLGRLARRIGQHQQAQEHLRTATTMYREMAMPFWLERADTALRQAAPPAAQA